MHRQNLLQKLHNYHPVYPQEVAYKQRIIEFVQQHPDCFERSLAVGHITASSMLLNKQKTHALLMHHAKLDQWFQLGGHCDGESDTLAVAIKEAQEESGIIDITAVSQAIFDIDVHLIPANKKDAAHYHYDIRYLLQVNSDENIVINNESKELKWFTPDIQQLPTQSQSVTRMFEKWSKMRP